MIRERLGANPLPMQLPIGSEGSFKGVVDLLTEKAIIWEDDLGKEPRETDIPEDLLAEVAKARALLIEHIAETDDALDLEIPGRR